MIDLRSDTVTNPTQKMRDAMYTAEVGDDVYGDDPTMRQLETLAAQILGKEAAIFVPSGTMGNQLAVMTHVARGGEVILGSDSHIMVHEVGAAAALSGAFMRALEYENGIPQVEKIRGAIRDDNIHFPETALIAMENPLSSGKIVPLEVLQQTYALAQEKGIPLHLDGARIFNGALALGVTVKELTCCCDSVMSCLSKGLCAPVGSILAGTKTFIDKARKNRKLLGGGMRQVGFLAAAGIIALTEMTQRLQEDHSNAKLMARELSKLPEVSIDIDAVEINMVFFQLKLPREAIAALPERMLKKGIVINPEEDGFFRFVTTNDVPTAAVHQTVQALKECLH